MLEVAWTVVPVVILAVITAFVFLELPAKGKALEKMAASAKVFALPFDDARARAALNGGSGHRGKPS